MRTRHENVRGRRRFLRALTAAGGGIVVACRSQAPQLPSLLGTPTTPYGQRSLFEKSTRLIEPSTVPETGSSRTPLQESHGIITPSSLHFERHHAGVPAIDPAAHRLMIHGMVERPLVLTVAEVHRLPAVSRIHFIECSGNSSSEWGEKNAPDLERSHGLASCSEW